MAAIFVSLSLAYRRIEVHPVKIGQQVLNALTCFESRARRWLAYNANGLKAAVTSKQSQSIRNKISLPALLTVSTAVAWQPSQPLISTCKLLWRAHTHPSLPLHFLSL